MLLTIDPALQLPWSDFPLEVWTYDCVFNLHLKADMMKLKILYIPSARRSTFEEYSNLYPAGSNLSQGWVGIVGRLPLAPAYQFLELGSFELRR